MQSNSELEKAKNEVMRKIGRNVINYQKMELMLKHIISFCSLSGYVSDLENKIVNKKESINKQTMGQLVGNFMTETHSKNNEPIEETPKNDMYISMAMTFDCDQKYYDAKKQILSKIVNDRNKLVHHLLPAFNPNSIESCLELDEYLDQKRKELIPEHAYLNKLVRIIEKSKKELVEYLLSDKCTKDIKLAELRQSGIVIMLSEISLQKARPDGWTFLSTAGEIISQEASGEINDLNKRLNFKTLKELILATKVFDIYEEPTEKGGVRILYRLKSDWGLSPATQQDGFVRINAQSHKI